MIHWKRRSGILLKLCLVKFDLAIISIKFNEKKNNTMNKI